MTQHRRDFLLQCAAGWYGLRLTVGTELEAAPRSGDDRNLASLAAKVLAAASEHGRRTGGWGTSVALSRGTLRDARGFGWCDAEEQRPVDAHTLFRIASVTKPITATIVRNLIDEGRLKPHDRAFALLDLEPDPDRGDPRLKEITIEQLLKHQGGWDRETAYDPMFHQHEIRKELQLEGQPDRHDIIRYMLRQPLQFAPGEKAAYSNFGYCVLGRIIERITEMPYADAVRTLVAAPLKIENDLLLGRHAGRQPRETEYSGNQQSFDLDVMDAHGGLIATPSAICRFLETYWISGLPRGAEQNQQWTHFGSLPGTAAMAWQRLDGWNVAVLINGRRDDRFLADLDELKKAVGAAFD